MARPTLFTHPKFRRLAQAIGGPALAVGHLELLWHVAYESGDDVIGDSLDVEMAAQWRGPVGDLTRALLEAGKGQGRAGFIEEVPDGRAGVYRIHDLRDHAPDYVKKRRARELERRVNGAAEAEADEARAPAGRRNARSGGRAGAETPESGAARAPTGDPPAPAPTPAPECVRDPRAGAPADPTMAPPSFDEGPPDFDAPAWWAIGLRKIGGWWDDETGAYAPDRSGLQLLLEKVEAALRGPGVPQTADEVEAFARACCLATRRLTTAWSKSWKPVGCAPGVGASNFDLVQRVARGELTDADLERTGRDKAAGRGGPASGDGIQRGAAPVRPRRTT